MGRNENIKLLSKPLLEWQKPIYRAMVVDPEGITTIPHRVAFLRDVIVSNRHNAISTATASPNHREVFQDILERVPRRSQRCTKRIFLSRGASETRVLRNRDALEGVLSGKGFAVVRPELLSFADQASAFYNADLIVTEFGAVMANVVFCKPGTTVVEIIPEEQNDPWSGHLCAALGIEHATLFHKVAEADRKPFDIGGEL